MSCKFSFENRTCPLYKFLQMKLNTARVNFHEETSSQTYDERKTGNERTSVCALKRERRKLLTERRRSSLWQ